MKALLALATLLSLTNACVAVERSRPVKLFNVTNSGCTAEVKLEDGKVALMDLTKMKQKVFDVKGDTKELGEIYSFSICGVANFGTERSCQHQMFVYRRDKPVPKCKGLGDQSELKIHNDTLTLHIAHPTDIHGDAYIKLECAAVEAQMSCPHDTGTNCALESGNHFVLKTKYACLQNVPTDSATSRSTAPIKWLPFSIGTLTLIIGGCFLAVYITLGISYGIGKGEKGLNRLPQSDFWLDLPLLVKDGAVFLYRGCKPLGIRYSPIVEDKSSPVADV